MIRTAIVALVMAAMTLPGMGQAPDPAKVRSAFDPASKIEVTVDKVTDQVSFLAELTIETDVNELAFLGYTEDGHQFVLVFYKGDGIRTDPRIRIDNETISLSDAVKSSSKSRAYAIDRSVVETITSSNKLMIKIGTSFFEPEHGPVIARELLRQVDEMFPPVIVNGVVIPRGSVKTTVDPLTEDATVIAYLVKYRGPMEDYAFGLAYEEEHGKYFVVAYSPYGLRSDPIIRVDKTEAVRFAKTTNASITTRTYSVERDLIENIANGWRILVRQDGQIHESIKGPVIATEFLRQVDALETAATASAAEIRSRKP